MAGLAFITGLIGGVGADDVDVVFGVVSSVVMEVL